MSAPVWIESTHQIAAVFTKALDKTTFLKFRAALMNIPSPLITDKLAAILERFKESATVGS